MTQYLIASLPGDGIGPEVVASARRVCETTGQKFGFEIKWRDFPFGGSYYLAHNEVLPPSALDDMAECQAMLLGAVGDPRMKPGILEQGLLLAMRFHFDQYLNLRPAKSYPGVATPVPFPDGQTLDIAVVRENTEDIYMGLGGLGEGTIDQELDLTRGLYKLTGQTKLNFNPPCEAAFSLGIMTRPAIERIARRAGLLARERGEKKVHMASKANAVPQLYGLWDQVVRETWEREFADLELINLNVDAMCYVLPRKPLDFGVLLCPNLFGDIVSDLVSALAGGLGLAASGSIGDGLSTFEPVHGSAPSLTNTGKANPLAAIMSGAMMLEHIGQNEAAAQIRNAIATYLTGTKRPFELGGTESVSDVTESIIALL